MLHSTVGPNADMVARCRFVIRKGEIVGYYTGNGFANQIGISTQVPRVIDIVSNNTSSSPREVEIGNRRFHVRKPIEEITGDNVYVLQMLDLLKDLDDFLDYGYEEAREKFADYIHKYNPFFWAYSNVNHFIDEYQGLNNYGLYSSLEISDSLWEITASRRSSAL